MDWSQPIPDQIEYLWVTSDGWRVRPCKMGTLHIINCMRYLKSTGRTESPLYAQFMSVLRNRYPDAPFKIEEIV